MPEARGLRSEGQRHDVGSVDWHAHRQGVGGLGKAQTIGHRGGGVTWFVTSHGSQSPSHMMSHQSHEGLDPGKTADAVT